MFVQAEIVDVSVEVDEGGKVFAVVGQGGFLHDSLSFVYYGLLSAVVLGQFGSPIASTPSHKRGCLVLMWGGCFSILPRRKLGSGISSPGSGAGGVRRQHGRETGHLKPSP
jgi:hypothetical protein